MKRSRSWKDNVNTKVKRGMKRYGKRSTAKYDTPFMMLDEEIFGKEEEI